jgi:hypothetical protein
MRRQQLQETRFQAKLDFKLLSGLEEKKYFPHVLCLTLREYNYFSYSYSQKDLVSWSCCLRIQLSRWRELSDLNTESLTMDYSY